MIEGGGCIGLGLGVDLKEGDKPTRSVVVFLFLLCMFRNGER